ncbi:hypothetical protein L227DRAFT_394889 [Lentinus tigrinus ALCF2SS1-6]|uniref:Uncharacterized protein n=1 Tax=Lentinus tigrinus ALCF2SS1-6 TaxID=1328759 RepID=A0A5C2SJ20_9APHY|nr:hypothetical protein L227DRAFT_394889 [Lentinus tigrinus ALCF2SS1-6]
MVEIGQRGTYVIRSGAMGGIQAVVVDAIRLKDCSKHQTRSARWIMQFAEWSETEYTKYDVHCKAVRYIRVRIANRENG